LELKGQVALQNSDVSLKAKMADYLLLGKVRLSFSVVFSAIAGYLLGAETIVWAEVFLLSIGGMLVVMASNGFNQILEKDRDGYMERTKNRPLPALRMSVANAFVFSAIAMLIGLSFLYLINPLSAFFGGLSIFIYVLVYTPLKAYSPLAVFVGAIPGAIPFMLGWVAATNSFGIESGALFALQFLWQFPHFWAIAWLVYNDYAKAGYYLLPTRKKDELSALLAIVYTIWMIVLSVFPYLGLTGDLHLSLPSTIIVVILGLFMLYKAIAMYKGKTEKDAKKLMLASILYLTFMQVVFVVDKMIV
jgi:protoheme IX farnesyltransferase